MSTINDVTAFSIKLLPDSDRAPDGERLGRIMIGDFTERFVVVAYNPAANASSLPLRWAHELSRLVAGASAVALRVQTRRAWVLYREDDKVHIQDQLLMTGWGGRFGPDGEIVDIPERTTRSDDGSPVSEWHSSLEAIRSFLMSGRRGKDR